MRSTRFPLRARLILDRPPCSLPGGLHSPFFEQRQKADCRILDLRVSENFPMLMQVHAQKVDDMVHWHRVPVPTRSGIRH